MKGLLFSSASLFGNAFSNILRFCPILNSVWRLTCWSDVYRSEGQL